MKIVITGSLGHIGKPLTSSLVRDGHAVTVISSNSDKKAAIEALGATPAIGNLQDLDFLTRVFEGTDAVYLMIPPRTDIIDVRAYYNEIGKNYAAALRRRGVGRVVFLSSMGADRDKGTGIILGAHDVEVMLDAIPDITLTHLRAGYFYDNLYNYTGQLKGAGTITDNFGGEDKLVLVATGDIADAAAEELVQKGTAGRIRYIASDVRTANEVARVLGAAVGIPDLRWKLCSDAQKLETLTKYGVAPALAAILVEMRAGIHNGAIYGDYLSQDLAPTGKVTLEQFAVEFAAAFKKEA